MNAKDNKSIIKELENVQNLIYESEKKSSFLEYESDINFSEKSENIKNALGSLKIPTVFYNFPIFPIEASYYAAVKKDKEGKEKIFKIVLVATVALLALFFLTHWGFLNTLSVLGIFATAVLGYFYYLSKKEYNKKKSIYDKSVEKFNETNKAFLSALEAFEKEKEDCIVAATEYSKNYSIAYDKFFSEFINKIDEETEAQNRIEEIKIELSNNDIIVPEYYHLIDNIIANLKSGRAEDYKEALNIAIREEKEEIERQNRLAQEERRTQILAMQAEEERRHNEQMERQQREHDEAVLREQIRQNETIKREQRQQAYAAKRQADNAASEARKQAQQTRMAGVSKCANCMNNRSCPTHIKESGAGLTCGNYKPYGSK